MKITAYQLLEEMVNQAAIEIGWPVSDENVEQVEMDLWNDFNVSFDNTIPVRWQAVETITKAVKAWQENTKKNHM